MLPTHISRVAINAILDLLFPLLLTAAGGSQEAARQAVLDLLADYHPNTAEELGLAGEIIGFRFKSLACLGASVRPGMPPAEMRDLEKTAAALRRNETVAQRKLDTLQRARRVAARQATVKSQPQAAASPRPPVAAAPGAAQPQAALPPARPAAPPLQPRPQAPAHAVATPPQRLSPLDESIQRATAGFTGRAPDRHDLTPEIAAAFARGDHHGLLAAVAGQTSAAVSAASLLHTA